MSKNIAIIKLKIGNYNSISKCLNKLNIKHIVTDDNSLINQAEKIILPGVGAFGPFVKEIYDKKIEIIIFDKFKKKKPILGICVGFQVLFEKSEESLGVKGLSLLNGSFKKFKPLKNDLKNFQKNHLGWNEVDIIKKNKILNKVDNNSDFFFNHNFYLSSYKEKIICGKTTFQNKFPSVVNCDKLYGVQFHPEKSQKNGLLILKNFCEKC